MTDGDQGIFTIVLSRSLAKFGYVVKKDSQTNTKSVSGTINANNQLILDGKVIGTLPVMR